MAHSFDKKKVRILLLEGIHPSARAVFEKNGYTNIEERPGALSKDALEAVFEGVRMVGIRSRTHLTDQILAHAPKLMVIGCFCIGTNQVDVDAARERGVPVFNAPFSNTRSVAELTLSSTIALLRKLPEKNAALQRGVWLKSAAGSHEVRGKTLGIVGYGNIGAQVSILAEHLGMQVIYFDIERKLPFGNARATDSLDELLAHADVVSLHVPETEQTKLLFDRARIAHMKTGACLINYSRGSVVDIEALAESLRAGHLTGAAIDVFPQEPESKGDEFVSPLRGIDAALLSPHVGGSTEEAQEAIGAEVAEKLVRYFDNGSTAGAVNFPHVMLPQHEGACRILNIHRNIPGVLKNINEVLATAGANIVGQFLQTSPSIGYVVTDIETIDNPESFRMALNAIEGSIRTRILQ